MENIKRLLVGAIAVACLAFCGIVMAGCGANDQEVITEGISAELDTIKNMDTDTATAMLEGDDDTIAALKTLGISGEDYFKNFFDGFDYEITDVTVDGDNATATIVVTCKSEKEFETAFNAAIEGDVDTIATMPEDEAYKYVGQKAMDTLSGLKPVKSDPIEITLTKSNGKWTEDTDTSMKVMSAMLAM